jgi:SAM-dependent methyltransferase
MRLDGIDLSEAQVELARRRAQALGLDEARFWCASAAGLPRETFYDGIIVHAVLHHLNAAQRRDLLAQLGALLVPGGRLYMYEPLAALSPRPLSARFLDRGAGMAIRFLKRLSRTLHLTERDIRQAVRAGWTMRSPNEAPILLSQVESELPPALSWRRVRYWHVFSVAYANFCMELAPTGQIMFSPAVILFSALDRLIFGFGLGPYLSSWPMAAIMLEKRGGPDGTDEA